MIQLPSTQAEFQQENAALIKEYESSKELVEMITTQTEEFMRRLGSLQMIEQWRVFFMKEKVLYETLNKM